MGLIYDGKEKSIGELIIKKRESLNMTVREFAEYAGMAQYSIENYEKGRSNPDTINAIKLAKALDCDILKLLTFVKQSDVYDDADVLRVFNMEEGFNLCDYPHFMGVTYNIRKNENPNKHICVYHDGKFLLFMLKNNRFGKEPLVLVEKGRSKNVVMAHFTDGKIFDIETGKEIKKARVIAQFKRYIKIR